ncbi:MAG: nucleotidyl transferase AbiEii/AbiGii toxin family protein [Pirellulaceae bacterium]|nr:nucleotidyl transferase AbiEii/AbiGii toxin family protein [Pirellulaceae bacterium]
MLDLSHLYAAAVRLQRRYQSEGTQFCFIGGLALQKWGEPRYTRDVDLMVFSGFGGERAIIERELRALEPRIDDAVEFAMLNRVLLVQDKSQCPIDISLAAMPYESDVIARSQLQSLNLEFEPLGLCSATDLIILKAFAGRPQDWQDIRGTVVRSQHLIDWKLIDKELSVLLELKEEPESLDKLYQLKMELNA